MRLLQRSLAVHSASNGRPQRAAVACGRDRAVAQRLLERWADKTGDPSESAGSEASEASPADDDTTDEDEESSSDNNISDSD